MWISCEKVYFSVLFKTVITLIYSENSKIILEKFKYMDMEDVEMINDDTRDDNYEFDKAGKEILLKLGSG